MVVVQESGGKSEGKEAVKGKKGRGNCAPIEVFDQKSALCLRVIFLWPSLALRKHTFS